MNNPWRGRATLNVLANWGGLVFTTAISFFLAPFVVARLGDSAYGAWVLVGSLVGYLGLLDLGVRSAVTKFVATHHAENDHASASQIVSAAFRLFAILGLIAIFVGVVIATVGVELFSFPPNLLADARTVFVLGGLTVASSLLGGVFGGVITARQRFDILNGLNIVATAVRALAIVLALRSGGGLVSLAVIQFSISVVQGGFTFWISQRIYPELLLQFQNIARQQYSNVLSFGLTTWLIHLFATISNYSDAIVIGLFMPIGSVTYFAIAGNLVHYTLAVVSGVSQTVTPMAAALDASGQQQAQSRLLITGSRVAMLVVLPILITLFLRGDDFIGLWMGEQYARPSGAVLRVLVIALWFGTASGICLTTLIGLNKHRTFVPILAFEALANLGLSILLIQSYGIVGVAWGTTIPRLIVTVFLIPPLAAKLVGFGWRDYWIIAQFKPFLGMVPFALITGLFDAIWPAGGLLVFFTQVFIALPFAALGGWLIALTSDERTSLLSSLRRRLHRYL